jgi:hypothetical protein
VNSGRWSSMALGIVSPQDPLRPAGSSYQNPDLIVRNRLKAIIDRQNPSEKECTYSGSVLLAQTLWLSGG